MLCKHKHQVYRTMVESCSASNSNACAAAELSTAIHGCIVQCPASGRLVSKLGCADSISCCVCKLRKLVNKVTVTEPGVVVVLIVVFQGCSPLYAVDRFAHFHCHMPRECCASKTQIRKRAHGRMPTVMTRHICLATRPFVDVLGQPHIIMNVIYQGWQPWHVFI
jgi:hypothetical protein